MQGSINFLIGIDKGVIVAPTEKKWDKNPINDSSNLKLSGF